VARLKFRHRIGLLVSLAATALVAVTIVTLVLGRRAEQQINNVENQYVPLLELDRDTQRITADLMKAVEDAALAAEESRLDDAAKLRTELLARLDAGNAAIVANGGDPAKLVAGFELYYTRARSLATTIIGGKSMAELGAEVDVMRRARRDFLQVLNVSTSPDRTRLAAAFATARASQHESLTIDIVVACSVLLLMGILSGAIIRRTVRSLHAVSDGVERLARGDFATPIDVPPGDEIGDLAREANRTATRLRELREEADREAQRAQTALIETQRQAHAAETANKELEAFSYSVSHDLRAPLRAIDGFSQALVEDEAERLSPDGVQHLERIRGGAQRMGELIDDLLRLSRVSRAEFRRDRVDVSALVAVVVDELRKASPERTVEVVIAENVSASADTRLVRVMLENLIGNAWKFTAKVTAPRIELGVRDDAFQRLHSDKEFPGTGIGLATVQRIVLRHSGRIWVEAAVGKGATFLFTLGA
jgi:signal transduction histidine kinase